MGGFHSLVGGHNPPLIDQSFAWFALVGKWSAVGGGGGVFMIIGAFGHFWSFLAFCVILATFLHFVFRRNSPAMTQNTRTLRMPC